VLLTCQSAFGQQFERFQFLLSYCAKSSLMAYNEKLAARTREFISKTHKITEEKKMFGGLCFMVNHKMCVGVAYRSPDTVFYAIG
jgi:hypothetical protein